MPSLRDVHKAFEKMAGRQKAAIAALREDRDATRTQIRDAGRQLEIDLKMIVPDLSDATLSMLERATSQIWTGRDGLVPALREMRDQDVAMQASLADHIAAWGTADELRDQMAQAAQDETVQAQSIQEKEHALDLLNERLAPLVMLAAGARPPLVRANRAEYEAVQWGRMVTDGTYRRLHRGLKAYAGGGHDYFNDVENAAGMRADIATAQDLLNRHQDTYRQFESQRDAREDIASKCRGADSVRDEVITRIKDLLIEQKYFATDLAREVSVNLARPVVLGSLKIRHLKKIETALDADIDTMRTTLEKLEAPLKKLAKGARHAPHKNIDIDLKKAAQGVDVQAALYECRRVWAGRARETVNAWRPSTPSSSNDFTLWQQMFLLHMVMAGSHADHGYTHQVFALDDKTAAAAGIDLVNLVPDYAAALPDGMMGLTESFNGLGDRLDHVLDHAGLDHLHHIVTSIDTTSHQDWSHGGGYDAGMGGGSFD